MAERTNTVPDSVVDAVEHIGKLTDEQFDALDGAIERCTSTTSKQNLTHQIASASGLEATIVRIVLDALVPMYVACSTWGQEYDFAKYTVRAIESQLTGTLPTAANVLEARLEKLLGHDSVSLVAKAVDIATEQASTFCTSGARILTDLRPVFTSDTEKSPTAVVMIHTLKISHHTGGMHQDFYCALDSDDLKHLGEVIARAASKEKSIRQLVTKADLLLLCDRTENEK